MPDRVLEWHPDGKTLLFASQRESGRDRFNQLYTISRAGGLPSKLPMPYGEFATFSPDGKKIAYTLRTTAFRTWKRYRGGMGADIWLFDLSSGSAERITSDPASAEIPLWHGSTIYFLSDRGVEQRLNIWAYDIPTKNLRQVTRFTDYDVHWPSLGPAEMVFEAGGNLHLLNLTSGQSREVPVTVVTDQSTILPAFEKVDGLVQGTTVARDGKRVVMEARGDLFSLPAENGPIVNLTATSGIAERSPAWSPDGRTLAYWSDRTGDYELTVRSLDRPGEERTLTSFGPGFRYAIQWAPNSSMVAFIDHARAIQLYDLTKNRTMTVDRADWLNHGALVDFRMSWSGDSRWLAWARALAGGNRNEVVFLYDTKEGKVHQVTSGYYADTNPVFDPDGKYLYVLTNRTFAPTYGDVDNSFLYPNTTNIAAIALRKDVPSPLAARNDTVAFATAPGKDEGSAENKGTKKDVKPDAGKPKDVVIDLADFESRLVILPPEAGNYARLQAVSGKLVYHRIPNTGSSEKQKPVKFFDLEEREEKTLIDNADAFEVSADGNKVLIRQERAFGIVDLKAGSKLDKKIPTSDMAMKVSPREEWKQIFTDAWRFERDCFYDPGMHGVDWAAARKQYAALLDHAVTRADVNFIIGEMIAELNASHTYRGGGALPSPRNLSVGYLGVDWTFHQGAFRIARIVRGGAWDAAARSPLDQPGVNVREGDYLLAVNGIPVNPAQEPSAAFAGLGGKTVELTVNSVPSLTGARRVVVETMSSEARLRYLAWVEHARKRVEDASEGKVGYIYVPNTAQDGQTELVRQFASQFHKEGLIIDERFNSGGQIPDRFIELLNRPALAYWAVRGAESWQWPPVAHFGPKVMLINGWSGSGGDAFPDYFRKAHLGPLIGTRTWGGLIGISGAPPLIDGGTVTVPTFRMYDPDGRWFREGHGVDPDIEVVDDPALMAKGGDPQLERAVEEVLKLIRQKHPPAPAPPPYEKR
jgi:tricorn protease